MTCKIGKQFFTACCTAVLLFMSVTTAMVKADEQSELKALEPSLDNAPPKSSTTLNGSVSRWGSVDKETTPSPQEAGAQDTTLKAETETSAGELKGFVNENGWLQFVGKSGKGKLSSDDYRKVEFGITGLVLLRMLLSRYPVIIQLYPGCPAESSGLQPGDIVLSANGHQFKRSDMQREYWRIVDGRAGTPVDVTVKRQGETMTFRMIRMNIEDIPNDALRSRFEKMLRRFGAPSM